MGGKLSNHKCKKCILASEHMYNKEYTQYTPNNRVSKKNMISVSKPKYLFKKRKTIVDLRPNYRDKNIVIIWPKKS